RRELADLYRELLEDLNVDLPRDDPDDECVYHLFAVWVDDRNGVQAALQERAIGTEIHYPVPVHLQDAYSGLGYERGSLPHTERACDRVLSLPLFPELDANQVREVASALAEIVGRRPAQ